LSDKKHYDGIFLIIIASLAGFIITALLFSAFTAPMGLERMCEEFNDAGE